MTANLRVARTLLKTGSPSKPKAREAGSRSPALDARALSTLLANADTRTRSEIAMGMQERAGNLAVQRLVAQARAVKPKGKAKPRHAKPKIAPKPKPPPPPAFKLFGRSFKVVAGQVKPAGKGGTGGWQFTAQSGGFDAERTMARSEWRPASGSRTHVLEKTSIQVSGATATAGPMVAVPDGTTLSIPLDDHEHPTLKNVTVGAVQAKQLDVPAAGLAAGDTLKLGSQMFVSTSLVPDTGPPLAGLFFLGKETFIQGGWGIEGADFAPFASTFTALVAANKVSNAEAALQPMMALLSEIEGGFATVQSADRGVQSFGFAQWTAASDLPKFLNRLPQPLFQRYFGKYGLGIGTPVLGTPTSVDKFAPRSQSRKYFNARNPGEHCLTLNGTELVTKYLHGAASDWSSRLPTLAASAQSAKQQWLAATTKAGKKAAATKIRKLWIQLRGLPGIKASTPPAGLASKPDQMADHLSTAATTAQGQAAAVVAGTESLEAIRTNEWVARFALAGRDEDVQAEEVHEVSDSFLALMAKTTSGIRYDRLMQSDRARATLYTTWINSGGGADSGIHSAVKQFHDDQVAAADAKSKPDWEKFPWPAADPRWGTVFDPVSDDFEQVAEAKLLPHTFDPPRRKRLIDKHFP